MNKKPVLVGWHQEGAEYVVVTADYDPTTKEVENVKEVFRTSLKDEVISRFKMQNAREGLVG